MYPSLISLSSNWNVDDIWVHLAWLISFNFLRSQRTQTETRIKRNIAASLQSEPKRVFLFDSARSAMTFYYLLLDLPSGTHVAQQAFTCLATVAPIYRARYKPTYIDIDESLNLDPQDLAKKYHDRLKVVAVQHTFGQPADLSAISSICRLHHLKLIEDLAHSWGAKYQGKPVGSFGQAAVLSFGSDKLISCGRGGALVINDQALVLKAKRAYQKLRRPGLCYSFRQAIYPPLTYLAKRTYHWPKINKLTLGKLIMFLTVKLGLVKKPISQRTSLKPLEFSDLTRLPSVSLGLLDYQISVRRRVLNKSRQHSASFYQRHLTQSKFKQPKPNSDAVWLRYNIFSPKRDEIYNYCKNQGTLLGNWYHHLIDPTGVNLSEIDYHRGSCPQAEQAAQTCLNLPTTQMSTAQLQSLARAIRERFS